MFLDVVAIYGFFLLLFCYPLIIAVLGDPPLDPEEFAEEWPPKA